jgi:hypothetical protein
MAANGFIALSGALSALDHLTGRSTLLEAEWLAKSAAGDPQPKATYLMLLTDVVVDADTTMAGLAALEVSGSGYSRQVVPWGVADASARFVANGDLIQFGPFSDSGGLSDPVTGAALVTRMSTGSGLGLMAWNLASPLTVVQNQALQLAVSALKMTLAVS